MKGLEPISNCIGYKARVHSGQYACLSKIALVWSSIPHHPVNLIQSLCSTGWLGTSVFKDTLRPDSHAYFTCFADTTSVIVLHPVGLVLFRIALIGGAVYFLVQAGGWQLVSKCQDWLTPPSLKGCVPVLLHHYRKCGCICVMKRLSEANWTGGGDKPLPCHVWSFNQWCRREFDIGGDSVII